MKTTLLLVLLSLAGVAHAASTIDVQTDEDACVNGWISMDVNVSVDGEAFKFSPSCSFSFDQTFQTSNGDECKIEAGMCSSFSPRNKIEVSCGGLSESAQVKCRTESRAAVRALAANREPPQQLKRPNKKGEASRPRLLSKLGSKTITS